MGGGESGPVFASAELFDPSTGAWSPGATMAQQRALHTATLLEDGRVLVVGGFDEGGQPLATAELYDPTSGTWSSAGSMATARLWRRFCW